MKMLGEERKTYNKIYEKIKKINDSRMRN